MNKDDLKQLIIAYKQVFESDHGKKVMEDLDKYVKRKSRGSSTS